MNRNRWRPILLLPALIGLAACRPAAQPATTPTLAPTAPPLPTFTAPIATPTTAPPPSATPPPATAIPGPPAVFTYTVVYTYPHDTAAYTEGLQYVEGVLYEGTGWYGQLSLRKVALDSGEILLRHERNDLAPEFFGEGITILGDKLYQLTWHAQTGFVYDKDTFEQLGTFRYPTEGWGLTNDGQQLIMSDGTATLHFLDPETLAEVGRVEVRDGDQPVVRLNELEYIHGQVYANVWLTDRIARIDPESGRVTAWIDLSGLVDPAIRVSRDAVLNGIAYDAAGDRLFVTGKLWPFLFEIKLREVSP